MLFWAGVLIEFVRTMVVFDYTQPNAMEPAFRASFSFAFGGGVCAWLNIKIGARRDWARMTSLVANVVTGIPSVVWIMQTMATSKVSGWAYIAEMGLNVVAIACLFTKPARDWFAGR